MVLVRAALDDTTLDEVVEATGEEVAGHSEIVGELVETGQTEVEVAEHERRPGVTDHVECPGHRAVHGAETVSGHTVRG